MEGEVELLEKDELNILRWAATDSDDANLKDLLSRLSKPQQRQVVRYIHRFPWI